MPNDGSSLGLSCTQSALKQIRLDYTRNSHSQNS